MAFAAHVGAFPMSTVGAAARRRAWAFVCARVRERASPSASSSASSTTTPSLVVGARHRLVVSRRASTSTSCASSYASIAGVDERTTSRSLLDANAPNRYGDGGEGEAPRLLALALAESEDLRCVDIMCQFVGDACACRLARVLDRRGKWLKVLDVRGNGLRALPGVIWTLRELEVLDASDNAIGVDDVPFDALIARDDHVAPNLRVLNISGNARIIEELGSKKDEVVRALARAGVEVNA